MMDHKDHALHAVLRREREESSGEIARLRAELARQARAQVEYWAWNPVEGSVDLKQCPCGELAIEGETVCSSCGAEPADDTTWRELSSLRAALARAEGERDEARRYLAHRTKQRDEAEAEYWRLREALREAPAIDGFDHTAPEFWLRRYREWRERALAAPTAADPDKEG